MEDRFDQFDDNKNQDFNKSNSFTQNEQDNTTNPTNVPPIIGNSALPNSQAILILGIVSIVLSFCYGFPGLAAGIVAQILAKNAKQDLDQNPGKYSVSSVKNLTTGKTLSLVGLIISAIFMVGMIGFWVFAVVFNAHL